MSVLIRGEVVVDFERLGSANAKLSLLLDFLAHIVSLTVWGLRWHSMYVCVCVNMCVTVLMICTYMTPQARSAFQGFREGSGFRFGHRTGG